MKKLAQVGQRVWTFFAGFFGRSLIRKLIFCYLLIIAVPTVFFGVYAFESIRSTYESDEVKNSLQTLQKEKASILRNMEICERSAQIFLSNKEFLRFVSRRTDVSTEELIEFKNKVLTNVSNIQDSNPDILGMRLFLDNKYFDTIWTIIFNESEIRQHVWRDRVVEQKGAVYWRLTHTDEVQSSSNGSKPPEVVSLYREVRYPLKEHLGILEINMLAKTFFTEMYSSLNEENSFMFLMKEGQELYYNAGNKLVTTLGLKPEEIGSMVSVRLKENEGHFSTTFRKKNMMLVYTYIKELDSYLIKGYSTEHLSKKLESMRNMILLGVTLGFLLLSAVTYMITSILLKKMGLIISVMRRVQDGDLQVEIPVRGNDEIGELARHFQKMMLKINELISVVVRKQAAAKEAEIKALQSQINKHFIYNVLEAVKMMAHLKKEYEISNTVTSLGRLMRYSMSWTRQYVELKDEIEHVRNYINLINVRYDNETVLHIEVAEELMDQEVLKMCLQPIVENSINHGIEPKGHGGEIRLRVWKEHECLIMEITDDGVGMEPEQILELREGIELQNGHSMESARGNGIGLRNVNERIKLFYGSDYGLEVYSEKDCYTKVLVKLPYRKGVMEVPEIEKSIIGG